MNVLSGLNITGLILNTEENFNSIPGLVQWNDARERVELQEGQVKSWGDKSINPTTVKQGRTERMPVYENGLWVKSESNLVSLGSNSVDDYRFLHNGSKFGIYAIMKNTFADGSITANSPFRTGSNGTTGIVITTGAASLGRFEASIRGGATVPKRELTNLLNPESSNHNENESIVTAGVVNMGQDLGVKMKYGNAVGSFSPFFPVIEEYPIGAEDYFIIAQGQVGMSIRLGLFLIYNWTGYTGAEVQNFDQRVTALLNKEKLIFENLDA
ncbi:hypothetical protein DVK85_01295 [Flavobacterium arcticum]|uniref:Uncharacterized protein n=1 Tax=Flavobacterium arcticum TaxID=1784713 RepID=A0A345H8M7_9FLAO|nr:hypothetical protein [Flavobacterium arcticum]AXG72937.1 hypothetical protein DVK85_01295 [Flavobacterium arcticum]KAF2510399.1 hypothetical protein E0W72_07910 [Flavobacterium arcticum]